MYRVASRDNIDPDRFERWPAVLNRNFSKFNNTVEELTFASEESILNWLESRSRVKSMNNTNMKGFKNGDPNKLYSVYRCNHDGDRTHDNTMDIHDEHLYSLRFKRPMEAHNTFANEKGVRMSSSFKKIDIQTHVEEDIEFSKDIRNINKEYFEGIYPIEINETDELGKQYMTFVLKINNMDEENKNGEFTYTIAEKTTKWIDTFLDKLNLVERYLEFFARGGNTFININNQDEEKDIMVKHIFRLMAENRLCTKEDDEMQMSVKNLVNDPILFNGQIYQVRFNKSFLTWHKNYGHMIRKYRLMPSRVFANLILRFTLADFFKQYQTKENIYAMASNLEDIYNVKYIGNLKDRVRVVKAKEQKKTKFNTVIRAFN